VQQLFSSGGSNKAAVVAAEADAAAAHWRQQLLHMCASMLLRVALQCAAVVLAVASWSATSQYMWGAVL
jgi:hypothetical protein